MPDRIEVNAPAKVNLFLQVVGRRPDGYHTLRSVFQKIDLADRLVLEKSDGQGITLLCPGSGLPEGKENLVYRAAELFLAEAGIGAGVRIELHKSIPVAAGLGGGSSDAAATLSGLDELFATGIGRARLQKIAEPLGADVPFFVNGCSAALVTGIGHEIEPCPGLGECSVVLANPGIAVSTKWVYESLALTSFDNAFTLACSCADDTGAIDGLPGLLRLGGRGTLYNDLQAVTIDRYPVIGELKESMAALGAAQALMSGSGPTVFGLFAGRKAAHRCCERLKETTPTVLLAAPLDSHTI